MKKNKILSLFLALVILFSSVPVGAVEIDKINDSVAESIELISTFDNNNSKKVEEVKKIEEKTLEDDDNKDEIENYSETFIEESTKFDKADSEKLDLENSYEKSTETNIEGNLKTEEPNNRESVNAEIIDSTDLLTSLVDLKKSNDEIKLANETEPKKLEIDNLDERIKLLSSQLGENKDKSEENLNNIIERIAEYYKGSDDDWAAMSLSAINKRDYIDESALITKAKKAVKKNKTSTDLERVTISLTALGYDVTKFPLDDGSVVNLIDKISKYDGSTFGTGLGTLNGYIFALIAYDSGNYDLPEDAVWTREALVEYILNNQLSDGGWNLYNSGSSDVDMTAAALQALAPYNNDPKVKTSIERGLDYLSREQVSLGDYKGSFVAFEKPNSNSTAWVILALQNLDIDADKDERFIKDGKSALDGLMSFKTSDNLFGYNSPSVKDGKATEQAFQALISYRDKKNIYLFDKPTKSLLGEITPSKIEIISTPKTEYYLNEKADTNGIKVKITYSDNTTEIISSEKLEITGLDTNTTGKKKVLVGYKGLSAEYWINVKQKETIKPTPQPTPQPTPTPTPTPPSPDTTKKPKAYVSVIVPPGANIHQSGWRMKEKTEYEIVPGTDNAFTMLQKTGLDYNYNYHEVYAGVYVNTIEGLAEFDGGPYSGWMYRVNGVFPNHSASLHPVYDGDYVEWIYTRDLGKDIGGYVPGVENDDGTGEKSVSVTVRSSMGGTISPSGKLKISKKAPITLYFRPDNGYVLSDIKLNDKSIGVGEKLVLTVDNIKNKDIISAEFKKIETLSDKDKKDIENKKKDYNPETIKVKENILSEIKKDTSKVSKFTDTKGHWSEDFIDYVTDKAYFKGVGDNKFNPNGKMTRAMFVTVLGRMDGVKERSTSLSFNDVDNNAYYSAYVDWAVKNNITSGVGDNKFAPDSPITREEMAKFIDSYLKYKNINLPENNLKEINDLNSISNWAKESVTKMYRAGILEGTPEGNFHPKNNTTRAEIAKVVYKIDKIKK